MRRLLPIILLASLLPAAAHAQQLRGRVLDEATRQPLANATVALMRGDSALAEVGTDAQGFYAFALPGAGEYRVRISHVGYVEVVQRVRASAGQQDVTVPAATLRSEAIRMETLEANAEAPQNGMYAGMPVARPMNRLTGEKLNRLEKQGVTTYSALRQLGAGLRVRVVNLPGGHSDTCVESTRRTMDLNGGTGNGACENVALILDGIYVGPASYAHMRSFHLSDYESIEFLTPLEAGQRWGFEASSRGALVIWTRGNGPHRSSDRGSDH